MTAIRTVSLLLGSSLLPGFSWMQLSSDTCKNASSAVAQVKPCGVDASS